MTRLSRSGLSPRLSAIAGIDTAIIVESSPSIKKAQPTISGMMIRIPSVRGFSGTTAIGLEIVTGLGQSFAFVRLRSPEISYRVWDNIWTVRGGRLMARPIGRLKAVTVAKTRKPGLLADGGGLYLRVGPT